MEFFVSAFQLLEVNGRHSEVLPFFGVTGEQQDLVPACSIEQDTFHVFQPVLITVHQGVVQENQGGPLGFPQQVGIDRKSTRLNSSHVRISYAVFCLKKKKT